MSVGLGRLASCMTRLKSLAAKINGSGKDVEKAGGSESKGVGAPEDYLAHRHAECLKQPRIPPRVDEFGRYRSLSVKATFPSQPCERLSRCRGRYSCDMRFRPVGGCAAFAGALRQALRIEITVLGTWALTAIVASQEYSSIGRVLLARCDSMLP